MPVERGWIGSPDWRSVDETEGMASRPWRRVSTSPGAQAVRKRYITNKAIAEMNLCFNALTSIIANKPETNLRGGLRSDVNTRIQSSGDFPNAPGIINVDGEEYTKVP